MKPSTTPDIPDSTRETPDAPTTDLQQLLSSPEKLGEAIEEMVRNKKVSAQQALDAIRILETTTRPRLNNLKREEETLRLEEAFATFRATVDTTKPNELLAKIEDFCKTHGNVEIRYTPQGECQSPDLNRRLAEGPQTLIVQSPVDENVQIAIAPQAGCCLAVMSGTANPMDEKTKVWTGIDPEETKRLLGSL